MASRTIAVLASYQLTPVFNRYSSNLRKARNASKRWLSIATALWAWVRRLSAQYR